MKKRRRSAPTGKTPASRSPDEVLPLRPTAFAVLAALASGPAAGFVILERVNEAAPRAAVLGPGTLYRLLREMRRAGLIERTAGPAGEEGVEDERRTYHALTSWGRSVMRAEALRLRRTLRSAGLLGSEGAGA